MYSKANPGKSPKGSVGVETFRGRLRLRLPRQILEGKQKYLALELPDTDLNRKMAEAKAKLIESNIALERFDYTLEKYGKPKAPTLTVVEAVKPKPKAELDLAQLWEQYSEADPELVKSLRRKGEFSEEFVTITLKSIDRLRNGSDLSIVLLALGGKRSPENAEILKRAHFCILLSSQPEEIHLWQEFAFAQGCEAIAKLESRLDSKALVQSHINFEQMPVTGVLWNLDREADGKSYEATIAQFADWLIERSD